MAATPGGGRSMNVQAILEAKGHDVVTTRPETSIADVCRLLQRRRIGAVPVIDDGGTILGILSERDMVAGLSEHGVAVVGLTAGQLMTRQVRHCHPDDSIGEIMAVMTNRRVRHHRHDLADAVVRVAMPDL